MLSISISGSSTPPFSLISRKPYCADHLLAFAHAGLRRQHLAVFVFAHVVANAAAASVLIEEVRGEADLVAHASADHVADRLAGGFADQVQAGDLDGGEGARVAVQRILARHQVGLRAASRRVRHRVLGLAAQIPPQRGQLERVHPDDARAHRFQPGERPVAAIGLAESGQAGIRLQLHDRAQRERRVQTVRTAQRRIRNRDRMQYQFRDFHGT